MDAADVDTRAPVPGGRLTRRAAVAAGGAGLASAALGVAGLGRLGVAQEGNRVSPGELADGDRKEFLFVQTFHGGSLTPKEGEADVYVLTLTGHAAQTVYFSDRPERIVGTVATPQFLDRLGFTSADPPNAALVAEAEAGEGIIVLELTAPVLSETFGPDGALTLTYEARVLAGYAEEGLAHLAAQQEAAEFPGSFGPASLFIDDCADGTVTCCQPFCNEALECNCAEQIGTIGPIGYCWNWTDLSCEPCGHADRSYWSTQCDQQFSGCDGQCLAFGVTWEDS